MALHLPSIRLTLRRCSAIIPYESALRAPAHSHRNPRRGKTTAARSLVESCGQPAVHIHVDDFWHFKRNEGILPYLPEAGRQNEVVMGALCAGAARYADGDYFVVIDDITGPWFLPVFNGIRHPLH